MAGGEWEVTDLPVLPGLYMNFRAAALATVTTGDRGTVVVPYKAHWGKIGGFTEIYRETDILDTFGALEDTNSSTFYKSLRMCCLGGAKKILGYRLASSAAAKASLTLQDAAKTDKVKLVAKYEGERGNNFKVTLAPSLTDEGVYTLKLYEDTTLLKTYSFKTWAELIEAVNTANTYILAEKPSASTDETGSNFATVTSTALTGGNSGIDGVTAKDYVNMLNVL